MTYNIATTEWPTYPISAAVKQLIGSLFSILDNTGSRSGDRLTDEIFAVDGIFDGIHAARGTEELRRCRDDAWNVIRKRRHEILKVYVADAEAADLMLAGKVEAELHDGRSVTSEFAARLVLDSSDTSRPKVKLYQAFLDTTPVMKAIQEH